MAAQGWVGGQARAMATAAAAHKGLAATVGARGEYTAALVEARMGACQVA